jgi:hypothetical protein
VTITNSQSSADTNGVLMDAARGAWRSGRTCGCARGIMKAFVAAYGVTSVAVFVLIFLII